MANQVEQVMDAYVQKIHTLAQQQNQPALDVKAGEFAVAYKKLPTAARDAFARVVDAAQQGNPNLADLILKETTDHDATVQEATHKFVALVKEYNTLWVAAETEAKKWRSLNVQLTDAKTRLANYKEPNYGPIDTF